MPYRKVGYIEQCFYIIKYAIADRARKRRECRTAKAIESALHIKLTDMQRQYIFGRSEWTLTGRCTGKTTAYCIKLVFPKAMPLLFVSDKCRRSF